MLLKPFEIIEDIPTGNPYLKNQFLEAKQSFKDVAKSFPKHKVFLKYDDFPTSILSSDLIFVYYNTQGEVREAEIFSDKMKENNTLFFYKNIDLLPEYMSLLAKQLSENGIDFTIGDCGIEVPILGLSYFHSNFAGDLNSPICSVAVKLIKV